MTGEIHRFPPPNRLAAALSALSDRRLREDLDEQRNRRAELLLLRSHVAYVEDRLRELTDEPPWEGP